jgi:hypothetical protein
MSLRIACDLDGTVADMDGALQRIAERHFGPGVTVREQRAADDDEPGSDDEAPETGTNGRVLTPRQMRAVWQEVRATENFWTTLDELEAGSIRRFAEMTALHRWHVVFMTRRPQTAGESTQRQSQRWLEEKGFPLPSVCIVPHSRGVLAGALGLHAVVDDRPETCLDVAADSNAEPILVWRAGAATLPPGVTGLGVTAVHTFQAALARLEDLSAAATKKPGLVERIKARLTGQ